MLIGLFMLFDGRCHPDVMPVLFGGNLTALQKKAGGIRPVAVGYTWRRIAAKYNNNKNLFVMKGRWMLLKNLKANHTTTVHVNKNIKNSKMQSQY